MQLEFEASPGDASLQFERCSGLREAAQKLPRALEAPFQCCFNAVHMLLHPCSSAVQACSGLFRNVDMLVKLIIVGTAGRRPRWGLSVRGSGIQLHPRGNLMLLL